MRLAVESCQTVGLVSALCSTSAIKTNQWHATKGESACFTWNNAILLWLANDVAVTSWTIIYTCCLSRKMWAATRNRQWFVCTGVYASLTFVTTVRKTTPQFGCISGNYEIPCFKWADDGDVLFEPHRKPETTSMSGCQALQVG